MRTHELDSRAHGAASGYQVVQQEDSLPFLDVPHMHLNFITAILKVICFLDCLAREFTRLAERDECTL
jgi:hypothetical protein